MTKLEEHIRSNREVFDSFEPSQGHMERFRDRLTPKKVPLYARIPYAARIAAVLVFVAISSVLIFEMGQKMYTARQESPADFIPSEYLEAQVYYTSQIKHKYREIEAMEISEPEQKAMVQQELEEMDRLYHSLVKDLQTNPTDERIFSTMISHYQMKLEIMGRIIEQLEEANKINSTYQSHENTEV